MCLCVKTSLAIVFSKTPQVLNLCVLKHSARHIMCLCVKTSFAIVFSKTPQVLNLCALKTLCTSHYVPMCLSLKPKSKAFFLFTTNHRKFQSLFPFQIQKVEMNPDLLPNRPNYNPSMNNNYCC